MKRARLKWLGFGLALALLAFAWSTGLTRYLEPERLQAWITQLGPLAMPGFSAIMLTGMLLALPSAPLMFAGGVLFGPALGFGLSWLTLLLGGATTYWISRGIGRAALEPRMPAKLRQLDERLERHGFRIMLILRLTPVIPYSGLNYGSGLTRIRFKDYFWGSAIGMIPGVAAYSLMGSMLGGNWPF